MLADKEYVGKIEAIFIFLIMTKFVSKRQNIFYPKVCLFLFILVRIITKWNNVHLFCKYDCKIVQAVIMQKVMAEF